MANEISRADVKAYAAMYVLRGLLHQLDATQPEMIDALKAGIEADHAASLGTAIGPPAMIFDEARQLLDAVVAART